MPDENADLQALPCDAGSADDTNRPCPPRRTRALRPESRQPPASACAAGRHRMPARFSPVTRQPWRGDPARTGGQNRGAAPPVKQCASQRRNSGCQARRLDYSAARSGPEFCGALPAGSSGRATALTAAGMAGYLPVRRICGEVAEWSKAHAWKVCRRGTVSRVRIPLSPP